MDQTQTIALPSAASQNALWTPSLGAYPTPAGVCFAVWAPNADHVDVLLDEKPNSAWPLEKNAMGYFKGVVPDARVGSLYRYRLDGKDVFPDPASRYQPRGVHGPSQVIDPKAFVWTDADWRGIASLRESVIYELHVGTFTPEGTFEALTKKLTYLADLGITTIEIMPVGEFPGRYNWGYDGTCLFSPSRAYGQPDHFRRFVDKAHEVGLAVMLDVVYNHLGPDGNYLNQFSPYYFNSNRHTPWGNAVNLDGEHSSETRHFFIENALHWIHEYHLDGLRLDATHALEDHSPKHFLAELTERLKASAPERHLLVVAEDSRNLATMIKPTNENGWGLDGVWSDDFHHQVRRSLAGDHEGYFRDFSGSIPDLVKTIQEGWFYSGQPSIQFGAPRGTDPAGIPHERFLFCLQNHDQIGNRAFGERLNHQIDAAQYRTAAALLLSVPETPLLFMGQEWSASTPFLYFTDHHGELGTLVTKGRREEFKAFSVFSNPEARRRIPDPQDPTCFERSRLNWSDLDCTVHSTTRYLFSSFLQWRKTELMPLRISHDDFKVSALHKAGLTLEYRHGGKICYVVIVQWAGAENHRIPASPVGSWEIMLSTESPLFCTDSRSVTLQQNQDHVTIGFRRPGVVILKPRNP